MCQNTCTFSGELRVSGVGCACAVDTLDLVEQEPVIIRRCTTCACRVAGQY